jgi:hypothetical protein
MDGQRVTEHLQAIAEEAVPEEMDLWPDIQVQITARQNGRVGPGRTSRWTSLTRVKNVILATGMTLILVMVGLVAMPKSEVGVVEFLGLEAIVNREMTPTMSATASATSPGSAFTGTPPSAMSRPTPTPVSVESETDGTEQGLIFEDTPYPDEAN